MNRTIQYFDVVKTRVTTAAVRDAVRLAMTSKTRRRIAVMVAQGPDLSLNTHKHTRFILCIHLNTHKHARTHYVIIVPVVITKNFRFASVYSSLSRIQLRFYYNMRILGGVRAFVRADVLINCSEDRGSGHS